MSVHRAAPFWCSRCGTGFRRSEHLERHIASHGNERPYQCLFCHQGFKRRDVLKRHWRTCKPRLEQDHEIPSLEPKAKGKKRKACDRCVRLKKACSQGYPCESCLEKEDTCTIEGVMQGLESHKNEEEAAVALNGDGNAVDQVQQREYLSIKLQGDNDGYLLQPLDSSHEMEPHVVDEANSDLLYPWLLQFGENGLSESSLSIQHLFGAETNQETTNFIPPLTEFWQSTTDVTQSAPDFDLLALGKFPFLSNFTRASGFVNSFECGTLAERQIIANEFRDCLPRSRSQIADRSEPARNLSTGFGIGRMWTTGLDSEPGWETLASNPTFLQSAQPQFQSLKEFHLPFGHIESPSSTSTFESSLDISYSFDENGIFGTAWSSDKLAMKTDEIVKNIKDITINKPRGSTIAINWSSSVEKMCFDFFSPPKLRKHLELFWSCWYPNCPIIHRPTFDIDKVSYMLLASMVLLGACLSPDSIDCAGAKIWFNSLEETIFSCPEFYDELEMNETDSLFGTQAAQKGLELLQAAYFISLVQNWEGSQESKSRIRRHRYNAIIAFVRDFGISKATLKNVNADDICTFQWKKFVLHESLIRTFIYVFLFDSAFVIFNNSPPRVMVPELKMDLACSESCFQAASSEECFVLLNSWNSSQQSNRRPNMSSTIKMMCHNQISAEHQTLFSSLSVLNMFVIVSGLHCLAFQIKSSLVYTSDISPIYNGIANWKRFWLANPREELIHKSSDLSTTMWRRTGFSRHSPEYWLLVKVALDKLSLLQQDSGDDEGLPPTEEAESHAGLSTKYDDSDMTQINALITTLQSVGLSP